MTLPAREFKDAIFEQFARAASAFASPKRIEIIDLLIQGERPVESIAGTTSMTIGNTSRHLQILRTAGMVATRREGVQIYYRVADESVVAGYLNLRALAEERIGQVRSLAEAFFGQVDGVKALGVADLADRMVTADTVLVDVRPRLEYDAGHLPGAVSIPMDELAGRLGELDSNADVVAYCRGPYCVLAAEAVALLRAGGHHASRLEAGPAEWRAAGMELAAAT